MKITDDLTKKLAKAALEVMQSSEKPEGTRSKNEEEFVKLHTDNVSVVDLSPDEKPFQDPPKQKLKESTNKGVSFLDFHLETTSGRPLGKDLKMKFGDFGQFTAIIHGVETPNRTFIPTLKVLFYVDKNKKIDGIMFSAHNDDGEKMTDFTPGIVRSWLKDEFFPKNVEPLIAKKTIKESAGYGGDGKIYYDDYSMNMNQTDKNKSKVDLLGVTFTTGKKAHVVEVEVDTSKGTPNVSYVKALDGTLKKEVSLSPEEKKEVESEAKKMFESTEEEMSDKEIEEALSKNAPASEWIKDFVHSKNPKFAGKSKEERIKMALGAYYGQKESVNESVLLEAPVKSSEWIAELANVVARSSDTKDLAMAFEAWGNSLYKTPAWNSIMRSPIIGDLVTELSNALDVYIGMSTEDAKEREEKAEDSQLEEEFVAADTSELETSWKDAKNRPALIKKYALANAISALRPGEVKLGLKNQLNGKKTFPALDDKGNLIIVTGTAAAPKIRYVK